MSIRATWKGYLKLALVSCPICLYPATSTTNKVKFNMLNRDTGNRLKQQYVDAETGAVVESEQRIKGYEIGKNEYLKIEPAELEAVQIESSRTIEIDAFVPRDQIDPRYCDAPYYLTPDGKVGQEAFAVIREAMRDKDVVGIGRIVLSSREHPVMLEPFGKGVRAMTLRYPYEVRGEEAYFADISDAPVAKELLELAATIVESKSADFDPAEFVDRYENALVAMIEDKKAGRPVKAPVETKASNVVNLADALRAAARDVQDNKPQRKPKTAATIATLPKKKTAKKAA